MLAFWVAGTRAVFALPLELRANWIFRVIPIGGAPECLRAGRRALLALSVVPLCVLAAVVYLWLGPWRTVLEHLLVLALLGVILSEVCLQNFQKLPFTCSYLPGKSRMHMAVMGVWPLLSFSAMGAENRQDLRAREAGPRRDYRKRDDEARRAASRGQRHRHAQSRLNLRQDTRRPQGPEGKGRP
jgi:hypothetical protein